MRYFVALLWMLTPRNRKDSEGDYMKRFNNILFWSLLILGVLLCVVVFQLFFRSCNEQPTPTSTVCTLEPTKTYTATPEPTTVEPTETVEPTIPPEPTLTHTATKTPYVPTETEPPWITVVYTATPIPPHWPDAGFHRIDKHPNKAKGWK